VQLYRYFVSQFSEFCFSTSVYCCCLFCYRLSPETFGYNLECTDGKTGRSIWCTVASQTGGSLPSTDDSASEDKRAYHNTSGAGGIAQLSRAGLRARWSGVWIPARAGIFCLYHRVHIDSEAHPTFYPTSIRGSFPGSKAAGTWSWPLTSMRGTVPLSPSTPSWRGDKLKHRDNFSFFTITTAL
jgi:hypothetical protein